MRYSRSKRVAEALQHLAYAKGERPRGVCTRALLRAKNEIAFLLEEIADKEIQAKRDAKELAERMDRFAAESANDFVGGKLTSREFLVAAIITNGMQEFFRLRGCRHTPEDIISFAITAADTLANTVNSASPIAHVQEKRVDVAALLTPIDALDLRVFVRNVLVDGGVCTLGDILNGGLARLRELRSGPLSLRQKDIDMIVAALAKHGFALYGGRFVMVESPHDGDQKDLDR